METFRQLPLPHTISSTQKKLQQNIKELFQIYSKEAELIWCRQQHWSFVQFGQLEILLELHSEG
jgi:hypothetical protein